MLATAAARFIEFAAAAPLFGAPLFLLRGIAGGAGDKVRTWTRRLLSLCALALLVGTAGSLFAQAAAMAGDPALAFDPATLAAVLTDMAFGYAILARLALAGVVLFLSLTLPAEARLWRGAAALGALILASFAWSGHGAADAGWAGGVHTVADILHLLAAGVWLGALAVLVLLRVATRRGRENPARLHAALAGFSGVGAATVAVLLASGLVNGLFLVGPPHLGGLLTSTYGRLLLAKLALFGLMLLLAAANRFRLTPALAHGLAGGLPPTVATRALGLSLGLETALGLGVLGLVAILGMLEPLTAQL